MNWYKTAQEESVQKAPKKVKLVHKNNSYADYSQYPSDYWLVNEDEKNFYLIERYSDSFNKDWHLDVKVEPYHKIYWNIEYI